MSVGGGDISDILVPNKMLRLPDVWEGRKEGRKQAVWISVLEIVRIRYHGSSGRLD